MGEYSTDDGQYNEMNYSMYYYKLVARCGTRLMSIYDGETEYKLGEVKKQKVGDRRGGGFYVYSSFEEALDGQLPHISALFVSPRVVLKCLAWGDCRAYGNKLCFSHIKAVEVLPCPWGYMNNRLTVQKFAQIKLDYSRKRLPRFAAPKGAVNNEYRRRMRVEECEAEVRRYAREAYKRPGTPNVMHSYRRPHTSQGFSTARPASRPSSRFDALGQRPVTR